MIMSRAIKCVSSTSSYCHSPSWLARGRSRPHASPPRSIQAYSSQNSAWGGSYVFESLELLGRGVETGDQLGMLEVLLVILHDQLAGGLVEGALGEGYDEQALDHLQDVVERPGSRVPVLLQGVDADLALLGYVGMEDLGDEEA